MVDKDVGVWYNCFGEVVYYTAGEETIHVRDRKVYLERLVTAISNSKNNNVPSEKVILSDVHESRKRLTSVLSSRVSGLLKEYLGGK